MKYVVTGSASGLGRYLSEEYKAFGVTRGTKLYESWDECVDANVIIHCAFNSAHQVTTDNVFYYIEDNVNFTDTIATMFGNSFDTKFIYMSSIAAYPDNCIVSYTERENIDLDQVTTTYGRVKLMAEAVVKRHCENHLILRLPSIIGKYMRRNSLVKAIAGEHKLVLTADSANNYVTYRFVKKFIDYALERNLIGTYNVVARDYLGMGDICRMFNNNPEFGTHYYCPPRASNEKIVKLDNSFDISSEQSVREFAEQWEKKDR